MTIDAFIADLEAAKPGFIPFQPYVCGMTRASVPFEHEDPCIKAAIHVYFGDQEGAHDQLQSLEGNPEADYLHGIIHRREGDFWNANYWFRRASAITNIIRTDPEGLTSQVGAPNGLTQDVQQELYEEWVGLVEVGLRRLQ